MVESDEASGTWRCDARLTRNFELNLEGIETFLVNEDAGHAYDALVGELLETLVPNLERFPGMGRSVRDYRLGSIETRNAMSRLNARLDVVARGGEFREYLMAHYLVLYLWLGQTVHLLSIRHHRQLSFDLRSAWVI